MDHPRQPDPSYAPMPMAAREAATQDALWHAFGVIYRRRTFILVFTSVIAIAAVVISLLLPNWYRASARVLMPEGGGGGISAALLGDLSSAAESFLGAGGGDYTRYLSILTSRTVAEAAIDSFNLVQVYDLGDSETPEVDAIEVFQDNLALAIDEEYEHFAVGMYDQDPVRAAEMANFLVRILNRMNGRLSSQTAALFRSYVEERYAAAEVRRDSVLTALSAFQRQYGVYDLSAQTQAFFEQLAALRAEAVQAEIQYEALLAQFGADNARVRATGDVIAAANRQYRKALAGGERVLPVPQDTIPDVIRSYLDLELERVLQERTLELIAPLLEQARFEEMREVEAVQVIDSAVPPVKKARPTRSIICIAATLSAFLLALLYVLLQDWWTRQYPVIVARLQAASAQGGPDAG